jgi:hypothetical protein
MALLFLIAWATACGPASGLAMGLFVYVFRKAQREGVFPPFYSAR